jgi:hypothetical protein
MCLSPCHPKLPKPPKPFKISPFDPHKIAAIPDTEIELAISIKAVLKQTNGNISQDPKE